MLYWFSPSWKKRLVELAVDWERESRTLQGLRVVGGGGDHDRKGGFRKLVYPLTPLRGCQRRAGNAHTQQKQRPAHAVAANHLVRPVWKLGAINSGDLYIDGEIKGSGPFRGALWCRVGLMN